MIVYPEQWKQYDENYWVSDQGRVKRVYKNGRVHYLSAVRRNKIDKSLRVKLHGKYVSLRRLVWKMFRGEIPDGHTIINKNGCHTMNELYNLICVPIKVSINQNNKSKMKKVINLDTGIVYPSLRYAARRLHVTHSTVYHYCKNMSSTPLYNLEYYDEEKEYGKQLKFIR